VDKKYDIARQFSIAKRCRLRDLWPRKFCGTSGRGPFEAQKFQEALRPPIQRVRVLGPPRRVAITLRREVESSSPPTHRPCAVRREDRKGAGPPFPQVGYKLWEKGTPRKGKSWDGKHLGCGGTHLLFAKGCGRRPSSEAPAYAGIRGRTLRTRSRGFAGGLDVRLRCSYRSRRGRRDMRCSSRSGWGEASTMSHHRGGGRQSNLGCDATQRPLTRESSAPSRLNRRRVKATAAHSG
jgi:hypothetical protein